ncbi:MAG: sigma-70 family RNA polymerase sigma factor [Rubripirellula sp.]
MNEAEISPDRLTELIARIKQGDNDAAASVFIHFRPRLKKMIALRMDARLNGRVDPSDVLQETFFDYVNRAKDYSANEDMPFFLWVRMITGQKLLEIHRRHLKVQARDVSREISYHGGVIADASASHIAEQLVGQLSSPSSAMRRLERQMQLQKVLMNLSNTDREILGLRHFEELSNRDTALLLGVNENAASNRYVRALERLKAELSKVSGFFD